MIKMRILIVEDERHLAEALSQILTEQHYQTDVVYDGTDGLDYALSGQYDAMILDVMLPKMDGFEVARRLREAHSPLPILMLTAKDEVSDKISGLDRGADDYMTKPFDAGELLARVRALTRRQGEVVGNSMTVEDLNLRLDARCLRTLCRFGDLPERLRLLPHLRGHHPRQDGHPLHGLALGLPDGRRCLDQVRRHHRLVPDHGPLRLARQLVELLPGQR